MTQARTEMDAPIDEPELVGRMIEASDAADDHRGAAYRAYFGLDAGAFPATLHWLLFTSLPAATRADGHAEIMQPFPALNYPRRMWAGGEVRWLAPIQAGDRLIRRSTITRAEPKLGANGAFLLASLTHEISRYGATCIEERQDIAFLPAVAGFSPPALRPAPFTPEWAEDATFGTVDLFRYSALTLNSHRIHYDIDYARTVEQYPGLVVHGPLLATTMVHRGLNRRPGSIPSQLTYRAVAPCFAGERLSVVGLTEGEALLLAVLGPDAGLRATARLEFAGGS